jgi:hypothetical protein
MKLVKLYLGLIVFSVFLPTNTRLLPQSEKSDLFRLETFGIRTDWEGQYVRVESKQVLQKINPNPGPGDWNSAPNLSDARKNAFRQAKERNRSLLNRGLEQILLDENYSLGEYLDENPSLKEKFIYYFNSEPEIDQKSFVKNDLILRSTIHFRGKNQLYSRLFSEFGGYDLPEFQDDMPSEEFTGLIIDARDLEYSPSLFPKIQSEYGMDLYGIRQAHPSCIQENGLVGYFRDKKDPKLSQRVGSKPYYLNATGSSGKNKTNLTIPMEEAKKILKEKASRRAIRNCRVAVLIHSK